MSFKRLDGDCFLGQSIHGEDRGSMYPEGPVSHCSKACPGDSASPLSPATLPMAQRSYCAGPIDLRSQHDQGAQSKSDLCVAQTGGEMFGCAYINLPVTQSWPLQGMCQKQVSKTWRWIWSHTEASVHPPSHHQLLLPSHTAAKGLGSVRK